MQPPIPLQKTTYNLVTQINEELIEINEVLIPSLEVFKVSLDEALSNLF